VASQMVQAPAPSASSEMATNCAEPENTNSDIAMVSNGCRPCAVASAPKITPKGAAPTMKGKVTLRPSPISARSAARRPDGVNWDPGGSSAAAGTLEPSDKAEIRPLLLARQLGDDVEAARHRVDGAGGADADAHAVADVAGQREAARRADRDAADARLQGEGIRRPFLRQVEPAVHGVGMRLVGQAGQDLLRHRLAAVAFIAPLGRDALALAVVDPARGDLGGD